VHKEEAVKILKNRVQDLKGSKHKGGLFFLRWSGDKISVFLEIALYEDCKPIKRKYKIKTQ